MMLCCAWKSLGRLVTPVNHLAPVPPALSRAGGLQNMSFGIQPGVSCRPASSLPPHPFAMGAQKNAENGGKWVGREERGRTGGDRGGDG